MEDAGRGAGGNPLGAGAQQRGPPQGVADDPDRVGGSVVGAEEGLQQPGASATESAGEAEDLCCTGLEVDGVRYAAPSKSVR
ncbi:hypothetical protein [Kitasatospora sp. NPDC085879]|uniref:hypothetical protein n=1 Tax=Kitasatospora sp. NPDC085879 TaxID=3154769 RepID=UPI003442D0D6